MAISQYTKLHFKNEFSLKDGYKMWQLHIALLLLHNSITKSYKIENVENTSGNDIKIKKEPMQIFLPPKDNGGVTRTLQKIKVQNKRKNDSTNDSFEFISSDLENSNSTESKIKGRPLNRRLYDGTKKDYLNRHIQDVLPSDMTSSDEDTRAWKEAWRKKWNDMKKEALIVPGYTRGDMVNMAAARPWSRRCGDPMQHDIPYGVCTVSPECDPELRIYRGDFYCGRSHFVCCGVDITGQDINQAIDVSFADSSRYSTSSNEKLKNLRGSKENKRRKREKHKKELIKQKIKKRRQIKRKIKKVLRDLYKQINRAYRNATDKKRTVSNNLKSLIYAMKQKLIKERDTARDTFHKKAILISKNLDDKLSKIKELNYNFLTNETFKNIVVKKSTNLVGARMLVEAYPELIVYPELAQAMDLTVDTPDFNGRRSGVLDEGTKDPYLPENYSEYDVEYGILNE